MNFLARTSPDIYRFFVWITAHHGRVHEKRPKDTEETWVPTAEEREQAKAGLKSWFWALIGTNRDESAFLGRRAGRRVSVSKSGLSRRDRDDRQVCMSTRQIPTQLTHGATLPYRLNVLHVIVVTFSTIVAYPKSQRNMHNGL